MRNLLTAKKRYITREHDFDFEGIFTSFTYFIIFFDPSVINAEVIFTVNTHQNIVVDNTL